MISYELALEHIHLMAHPLGLEVVPLMKALGRVVAEDIFSPSMSPPFDNSAMDGFALNAEETSLASLENPIYFSIKETVAAGHVSHFYGKGTTVKIMTGAPLPKGYNTVLVVEEAQIINGTLCITKPINAHQNVRCCGEDIQHQELLIKAGEYINSNRLMTLASVGISAVTVMQQPKISVLSTGAEVVDNHEQPLLEGEIYNSNYPYLINVLQASGLKANYLGNTYDDLSSYKTCINRLLEDPDGPEIIISTGAVSKGDYDYIPDILRELGWNIIFHGVNIRPGKPVLFATLGNKYYFGLPGNPVSTAVGCQFFIFPLIRRLQGLPKLSPAFAKLNNALFKKGAFRQFLKARVFINQDSHLLVEILKDQESFKIKPFLQTNAWAIAQEEIKELKPGDLVPVIFMPECNLRESLHE